MLLIEQNIGVATAVANRVQKVLEDANIKTAAAGGPTLARAVAQYMPPRTLGVNVGFNF